MRVKYQRRPALLASFSLHRTGSLNRASHVIGSKSCLPGIVSLVFNRVGIFPILNVSVLGSVHYECGKILFEHMLLAGLTLKALMFNRPGKRIVYYLH